MSFSRFYNKEEYGSVNTGIIDLYISNSDKQNQYYAMWINKYKKYYTELNKNNSKDSNYDEECNDGNDKIAEWKIRYYKSTWEMFSSAVLFTEAEFTYSQDCYVSFYFDIYYSLLHAMQALIYLSPSQNFESLFRMSHHKIKNCFSSLYCCKKQLFHDSGIIEFFEELKYMREFYSYNTPMNLIPDDIKRKLNRCKSYVTALYQAISFHLYMIRSTICTCDHYDRIMFNEKFDSFFSNTDLIKLNQKKKMITNKLKYRKKKVSDYSVRFQEALNAAKTVGSLENKTNVKLLNKKYREAQDQKVYYENELQRIKKDLKNVKIDIAAENIRRECNGTIYPSEYILQWELDHLFDEFHTYDWDQTQNKNSIYDFHKAFDMVYDAIM